MYKSPNKADYIKGFISINYSDKNDFMLNFNLVNQKTTKSKVHYQ